MFESYYVNMNEQSNGDHEVHKAGCSFLPDLKNRVYLGEFDNCRDAVEKAKTYYVRCNGCYYCSRPCHTS